MVQRGQQARPRLRWAVCPSQSPEEGGRAGECAFCGKAGRQAERVGGPVSFQGSQGAGPSLAVWHPILGEEAGGSWLRRVPRGEGEGPGSLSVYCKSAPGGPDPAPGASEQGV